MHTVREEREERRGEERNFINKSLDYTNSYESGNNIKQACEVNQFDALFESVHRVRRWNRFVEFGQT